MALHVESKCISQPCKAAARSPCWLQPTLDVCKRQCTAKARLPRPSHRPSNPMVFFCQPCSSGLTPTLPTREGRGGPCLPQPEQYKAFGRGSTGMGRGEVASGSLTQGVAAVAQWALRHTLQTEQQRHSQTKEVPSTNMAGGRHKMNARSFLPVTCSGVYLGDPPLSRTLCMAHRHYQHPHLPSAGRV